MLIFFVRARRFACNDGETVPTIGVPQLGTDAVIDDGQGQVVIDDLQPFITLKFSALIARISDPRFFVGCITGLFQDDNRASRLRRFGQRQHPPDG